jgi:6-hydroxycyclohex-1-ene-1-carbonyl-CoA dehydrogenase
MTASGVPLALSEFEAKPAPGEAVVKIAGCGVCHTDLGYYNYGVRTNHALPLCLGHEISGHVVVTIRGRVDRQRFALKAARHDYVVACERSSPRSSGFISMN